MRPCAISALPATLQERKPLRAKQHPRRRITKLNPGKPPPETNRHHYPPAFSRRPVAPASRRLSRGHLAPGASLCQRRTTNGESQGSKCTPNESNVGERNARNH